MLAQIASVRRGGEGLNKDVVVVLQREGCPGCLP